LQAVGAADVFQQAGRLHSGFAAECQAAPGLFEQRLHVAEFRQGLAQGEEGAAVELQHHIAAVQVFAGGQVADPVVGQVRADQRNMPGTECADVIARHQLAAALADQVDLEFRVVIPARQFVGVVMFEPAKTVFRLGQDHFEFRGAVFEQLGAADGHGDASCTWGIAPKYACWRQPRYRSFRPILILF
jgi:hypothetical protein